MRIVFLVLLFLAGCAREEDAAQRREAEPEPAPIACVNEWTEAAPGIDYRMLNCTAERFDLHLVRVDPKRAAIDAVVRPGSTASDLGKEFTFAINANFFDENFKPLGVVVTGGRQVNATHPVKWQSVFSVDRKGRASITPVADWDPKDVQCASQCGPRLVVGGKHNDVLRADPAPRSGVCIDNRDQVVFFATPPETQLDVHQTRALALEGMQCRDAMLFDGGPSTQLFLRRAQGEPVVVEGDKRVPAYMVVSGGKR